MWKKSFITGLCTGIAMGGLYYMLVPKNEAEVIKLPVLSSKADSLSVFKSSGNKENPNYRYFDWNKENENFDPKNERFLYYAQMNVDQIKEELKRLNSAVSPDASQYIDVGDYYNYEYLGIYYLVYKWASVAPREALNFQERDNIDKSLLFFKKG